MENNGNHGETSKRRLVCFYCGTVYDEEAGRCPLCGSTTVAGTAEDTSAPEEPEAKTQPGKGKFEGGKKGAPKGLLIAAVVFLFLAVAVVTYFIGDMIGWWPGPEDQVQRTYENTASTGDTKCTLLAVDPETIDFAAVGETRELTVRVNADCDEVTYCNSSDASVATISLTAETNEGAQTKSAVFTVTAVGGGEAMMTFTCGDKKASCRVTCPEPATQPTETQPTPGFEPEMNLNGTIVFNNEDDQAIWRVANLPEGTVAEFTSSDENVVTVDEEGCITAVGEGTATVTVNVGGGTKELNVRVDFSRDAIDLNRTYYELDVEKYFILELRDENGDAIEDAQFTVEDENICEYRSDNSRIYGLQEGKTQIFVTYNDETYVCIVDVV